MSIKVRNVRMHNAMVRNVQDLNVPDVPMSGWTFLFYLFLDVYILHNVENILLYAPRKLRKM